jgi:CRP-like cAMP-binding protein
VRQDDPAERCHILESGTVSRSVILPNGSRQIVFLNFAGDFIDLGSIFMPVSDQTSSTHEASVVVDLSASDVMQLAADFPDMGRALWLDTVMDAAINRQWVINLGQLRAAQRLGHLLLETGYRLEQAGVATRTCFPFPINQTDLAQALGLTTVHVSRTIGQLRRNGYIRTEGRKIIVADCDGLSRFSCFSPAYLDTSATARLCEAPGPS